MLRIISGVVIVYFGAQLPSFTLEETREPSYTYFQYQNPLAPSLILRRSLSLLDFEIVPASI